VARTQLLGAAIAPIVLIGGWYLIQNQVRYGDPLAAAASRHYLAPIGGLGSFGPYVVTDPLQLVFAKVPSKIFARFWYGSIFPPFSWPALVNALFWVALALSLTGLLRLRNLRSRRPKYRSQLGVLLTLVAAAFASVWIVAFNTAAYDPRLALLGLPALACLAALGLERWKLPVRLVLPLMGLCGTLIAIQQNVLAVNWNH
jgi:hypothetical protein